MEDRYKPGAPLNSLIYSARFSGFAKTAVEKRLLISLPALIHPNHVILLKNDWGTSVYFVLEGWVEFVPTI